MDTLGVCGASSTAGDNGVVMVKEPRLERVSENLDSPQTLTILNDVSEWTDAWTQGETSRTGPVACDGERLSKRKVFKCVMCVLERRRERKVTGVKGVLSEGVSLGLLVPRALRATPL